jgi:hypothetical protein
MEWENIKILVGRENKIKLKDRFRPKIRCIGFQKFQIMKFHRSLIQLMP